jgi:hypothetical protein
MWKRRYRIEEMIYMDGGVRKGMDSSKEETGRLSKGT